MYTLITGASTGIGKELAQQAAADGKDLILVARSEKKLQELRSQLLKHNIEIQILVLDLAKPESANELFTKCSEKNWEVETLINNAGFGAFGKFHEQDLGKQLEMIQLNVSTLTGICHLFLPQMIKRKSGHIMNVASTAAFAPGPLMAVYYATKAFVLHFSEAISTELEGTGVHVTALCPGPTESEFQNAAGLQDSRLFTTVKLPSSKSVAQFGWKALQQNQVVAVHGLGNKILSVLSGWAPRPILRKVILRIQDKRQTST